ncbi:signal peptidase I [Chloroflexota bacterium]
MKKGGQVYPEGDNYILGNYRKKIIAVRCGLKTTVSPRLVAMVLLVFTLMLLALSCSSDETVVIGGESMAPTLKVGDSVKIDRYAYSDADPERGDVVLVLITAGQSIASRIIGLPGDTIVIEYGAVYLNGTLLDEPYLAPGTRTESNTREFNVPANSYFILGDNRPVAPDSRQGVYVSRDSIHSKVIL